MGRRAALHELDPRDRNIRRVKGGRYQARPYDLGERFDLGIFDTLYEARRAIRQWRLGQREPLPRHVREYRPGKFLVVVFGVRVGVYPSRDDAARAARDYIAATFGAAAVPMFTRRLESSPHVTPDA